MGNNLFNADIAGKLAKALGPKLLPFVLRKVTPGTRSTSDPSAGTNPTTRNYPCRGILESYRDSQFDGTIIQRGDRKALLLGGTLPTGTFPTSGDVVVAEGSEFKVVAVDRDPDAATYSCQIRGAS